jgi:hypothetical protein
MQAPPHERRLRDYLAEFDRAAFGCVCRQMEALICQGQYDRAIAALREFIAAERRCNVDMATPVADVFPMRLALVLESRGYVNLQACRYATDDELLSLRNLGPIQLKQIRDVICDVLSGQAVAVDSDSDLEPDWPRPDFKEDTNVDFDTQRE